MAWVPNGSAMQIAEPWKPLPQPTEEEKKGPQRLGKRAPMDVMTLVVFPPLGGSGLETATVLVAGDISPPVILRDEVMMKIGSLKAGRYLIYKDI